MKDEARVLTDEELRDAVGRWQAILDAARAVERAVLAKLGQAPETIRIVKANGEVLVSEAEARRREREAWVNGYCRGYDDGAHKRTLPRMTWDEAHKLYPAPKVMRPREITLSDGRHLRMMVTRPERWQVESGDAWHDLSTASPLVGCAADARLVADCWDHPTFEGDE